MIEPPESVEELLARGQRLAGRSLGVVADELGLAVPPDLRRAKGWVGQLVERALGASSGSKAQPDFLELGVELKTLPVGHQGKPRESTFVTTVELGDIIDVEWEQSRVFHKLRRVLWVPVLAEPGVAVAERRIGSALLWRPSDDEDNQLRADWIEIAGIFARDLEGPSAHAGQWLQVRPKAASSRVRRIVHTQRGERQSVAPRGFYLRARFTAELLKRNYVLP